MLLLFYFYIFALGACVGSFLTAWTWRLWNGRSMTEKHSVCPHCGHQLGALDLVPILSYVMLRGRCRYCHKHISLQYPVIELMTGLLFVWASYAILVYRIVGFDLNWWVGISLVFTWAIFALLVALFVFDLRWGYLPDIWTLGGSALVAAITLIAWMGHRPLFWQASAAYGEVRTIVSTILSAAVAAAFFLLIIWASQKILHKDGMGLGDVKLALMMGLFLGFPGIVVALYLAFILGAVLSLLLLAAKQKNFDQTIPFGPILIVGTLLAWWLTPQIVGWYQQLFI